MIKLIITILLPFIAPMIAYSIWQKIIFAKESRRMQKGWVAWCLLIGTILVVLSLFTFGLPTQSTELGTYQPPTFQDGKVQPGKFD